MPDKRLSEIQARCEYQESLIAISSAQSHLADLELAIQCDTSATRFALGEIRAELISSRQDIPWLLARDKARDAVLDAADVLLAYGMDMGAYYHIRTEDFEKLEAARKENSDA